MFSFFKAKPYNRSEVLALADQARVKGRHRKAIKHYRAILAVDPSDAVVLGKLAPLLARNTRLRGEALASFQQAAQGHLKAGFSDRAIAVYVQAAEHFPERAELWADIANTHRAQGRRADAVNALVKGGGQLARHRALRAKAVELFEAARALEPWHFGATTSLARLLAKQGDRAAATALLEELATRVSGRDVRLVRWHIVRISPTPRHLWRWFRA